MIEWATLQISLPSWSSQGISFPTNAWEFFSFSHGCVGKVLCFSHHSRHPPHYLILLILHALNPRDYVMQIPYGICISYMCLHFFLIVVSSYHIVVSSYLCEWWRLVWATSFRSISFLQYPNSTIIPYWFYFRWTLYSLIRIPHWHLTPLSCCFIL